jgi:3'-5' exoribonuclease
MISELLLDQTITGFFAVKSVMNKDTRDQKKKYLDLTLVDASGEINAKVWDIAEVIIGENPELGDVIKVEAVVQEYKGSLQLKVNKLRKATETDVYEAQTVIPSAPISPDRMWAILTRFAESITDKQIHSAVAQVLQKYKNRLMYYPAAKSYHHSYQCGLLQHITTMLIAGEKLSTVYSCNTDLLYAGIILHDIGKLHEFSTDNTAIGTEYTVQGELLGHIALGLVELESLNIQDAEKKLLLQHMILSHHDIPEWGSPKRPMTKEAELLQHLDLLDARMFDFEKAAAQPGTISGYVRSLERKVYCPVKEDLKS